MRDMSWRETAERAYEIYTQGLLTEKEWQCVAGQLLEILLQDNADLAQECIIYLNYRR